MTARTIEPTLGLAVRVWWAWAWRWAVLILVPTLPLALFLALVKPHPQTSMRIVSWASLLIAVWAQIEAMRRVLKLDFPSFSVRLQEKRSHE